MKRKTHKVIDNILLVFGIAISLVLLFEIFKMLVNLNNILLLFLFFFVLSLYLIVTAMLRSKVVEKWFKHYWKESVLIISIIFSIFFILKGTGYF